MVFERLTLDPSQQRQDAVLLPLGRDLENRRERGVAQVGVDSTVGFEHYGAGGSLENDLGDVMAERLFGLRIDFGNLVGDTDATLTELFHDLVVVTAKADDLIGGPEFGGRRGGTRHLFAAQLL